MKHLVLLLVIAASAIAAGATSASASNDPVRIDFAKSGQSPGVWTGSVSGDVNGDLTTRLTELRISGPIWHVRFDWIIDAEPRSFVADLSGTLNTSTGQVVMNGTVVEGRLLGARVHEVGQLTDPDTLGFAGEIRIMPATA